MPKIYPSCPQAFKRLFEGKIKSFFAKATHIVVLILIAQAMPARSDDSVTPSFLSCDGKWSDFIDRQLDVPISSGRIKLVTDGLFLSGFPSFGASNERYVFTRVEQTIIFFQHSNDARWVGSLNRLTGGLNLSMQRSSTQTGYLFQGVCKVSQRLF